MGLLRSAETGVGDPLAPHQVLDDRAPSSRRWREWVEPADPYRVGLVCRPVREGTALGTRRPGQVPGSAGHGRSVLGGPWRPRPTSSPPVGAAVSQAPVGEVLVGEGLEGLHDRLDLAGHQRARRGSGPTIIQLLPTVLAASPAPVASVGQHLGPHRSWRRANPGLRRSRPGRVAPAWWLRPPGREPVRWASG